MKRGVTADSGAVVTGAFSNPPVILSEAKNLETLRCAQGATKHPLATGVEAPLSNVI